MHKINYKNIFKDILDSGTYSCAFFWLIIVSLILIDTIVILLVSLPSQVFVENDKSHEHRVSNYAQAD